MNSLSENIMRLKLIFLPVFAFAFSACSLFHRPAPLDLNVVNLQVSGVSLFETSVTFTVRIANESPEPITITGGAYDFYLNDTYIGKGLDAEGFTVARLSTTTKEITVNISNLKMITKLQPIVDSQKISYRISGKVYPENSFFSAVPVEEEGEIEFADFDGTTKRFTAN